MELIFGFSDRPISWHQRCTLGRSIDSSAIRESMELLECELRQCPSNVSFQTLNWQASGLDHLNQKDKVSVGWLESQTGEQGGGRVTHAASTGRVQHPHLGSRDGEKYSMWVLSTSVFYVKSGSGTAHVVYVQTLLPYLPVLILYQKFALAVQHICSRALH